MTAHVEPEVCSPSERAKEMLRQRVEDFLVWLGVALALAFLAKVTPLGDWRLWVLAALAASVLRQAVVVTFWTQELRLVHKEQDLDGGQR